MDTSEEQLNAVLKNVSEERHRNVKTFFFFLRHYVFVCQSDGKNYYNQTFKFLSYLILLVVCPLTSIMEYQVK